MSRKGVKGNCSILIWVKGRIPAVYRYKNKRERKHTHKLVPEVNFVLYAASRNSEIYVHQLWCEAPAEGTRVCKEKNIARLTSNQYLTSVLNWYRSTTETKVTQYKSGPKN